MKLIKRIRNNDIELYIIYRHKATTYLAVFYM